MSSSCPFITCGFSNDDVVTRSTTDDDDAAGRGWDVDRRWCADVASSQAVPRIDSAATAAGTQKLSRTILGRRKLRHLRARQGTAPNSFGCAFTHA